MQKYDVIFTPTFKRDYKFIQKRGYDTELIKLDYATANINIRINLSLTALSGFLGVPYTLVNRWEILSMKIVKKKSNCYVKKIIFRWRRLNNER